MDPLKIIAINCRSVRSTVKFIHVKCEEYNVVLVQESWPSPTDINYLSKIDMSILAYCGAAQ